MPAPEESGFTASAAFSARISLRVGKKEEEPSSEARKLSRKAQAPSLHSDFAVMA